MDQIDQLLTTPHWICSPSQQLRDLTSSSMDLQKRLIVKINKFASDAGWHKYFTLMQASLTDCAECCRVYRQIVSEFDGQQRQQALVHDTERVRQVLQQKKSLMDDNATSVAFMDVLHQPLLSKGLSSEISRQIQIVMAQSSKLFIPVISQRELPLGLVWFALSTSASLASWSRQVVAYLQKKGRVDLVKSTRCSVYVMHQAVQEFAGGEELKYDGIDDVMKMVEPALCQVILESVLEQKHLDLTIRVLDCFLERGLQVSQKCLGMLQDMIASDKIGMKPLVGPLSKLLRLSVPINKQLAPSLAPPKQRSDAFKQLQSESQRDNVIRSKPVVQQKHVTEANTVDKILAEAPKPQRKVQVLGTDLPSRIFMPTDSNPNSPVEQLKSVDEFVNEMLTWNLFEVVDKGKFTQKSIPDNFRAAAEYVEVMDNLSQLEFKAQLTGSRDSIRSSDFATATVHSIQAVNDTHEVTFDLTVSDCNDNDIVLLVDGQKSSDVLMDARNSKLFHILGIVQHIQRHKGSVQVKVKLLFSGRCVNALGMFRLKTQWWFAKVTGLNTTVRELSVLYSMSQLPLFKSILNPVYRQLQPPDGRQVESISRHCDVNEPQAQAIAAALSTRGFTLIQGPPGSGKSKTIIGLVGEYLTQQTVTQKKPHVLVCAPSNAAVDELVRRFRQGIFYMNVKNYKPSVARLGTTEGCHESVRDVTLDSLIEARVAETANLPDTSNSHQVEHLRTKLNEVKALLDDLYNKLDALETPGNQDKLQSQIRDAYANKQTLLDQINAEYSKRGTGIKALDIVRQKFKTQILNDAQIICCTLSSSGHEVFKLIATPFDTVIIDEACQSVEVSTLIPLQYGATRCVLVGDPNQLPPTVLSSRAQQFGYDQSLFVRLQKSSNVHLLSIQYRMHPEISKFPSAMFYDHKLKDGPCMLQKNTADWHTQLPAYMFYDLDTEESRTGKSLHNEQECAAVVQQYQQLIKLFPNYDFAGQVGVITPYKEQKNRLTQMFTKKFGSQVLSQVDINTIDGFQGQEKQVILFSCVRANTQGQIGFLSDVRRLNVALTRAKSSLWIFGSSSSLKSNKFWSSLIEDAVQRGCYTKLGSKKRRLKTGA